MTVDSMMRVMMTRRRRAWTRWAASWLLFVAAAACGTDRSQSAGPQTAASAPQPLASAPESSALPQGTVHWPSLSSALPATEDGAKDAAVIVAIENYAFLPPIPGAVDNGRDWFVYLSQSRNIPVERIQFLANAEATDFAITRAVERASSIAEADGRVWLIFIGHGAPSSTRQEDGLLVAADAQQTVEGLENRSVSRARVLELLSKSPATPVVLVDACFSGRKRDGQALIAGLQPTSVIKTAVPAGAVLMTAAASNEYAGPLPGDTRPAFSYLALGALRGWGDSNGDGTVTPNEVVDYSRSVLTALLSGSRVQTPEAAGQQAFPVSRGSEPGPDLGHLVLQLKAGSVSGTQTVRCPAGSEWDGRACLQTTTVCPPGTTQSAGECIASAVRCPSGATFVAGEGCIGTTARDRPGRLEVESPLERPANDVPSDQATAPVGGLGTSSSSALQGAREELRAFDRVAAKAALDEAAAQVKNCRGGPSGPGRVQVRYDPSGNVAAVSLLTRGFEDTVVGSCIRMLFRRATVPPFTGAPVVVVNKSFDIP